MNEAAIETSLLKWSVSITLKITKKSNYLKRLPDLSEALDIQRRLHLLVSTEQSQLHSLVNDLQSKLIDAYLNSEVSKQSCITDYFNQDL